MHDKRHEQEFWDHEYAEGGGIRARFYGEINAIAWEDIFRKTQPLRGRRVAFVGCGTAAGPVRDLRRLGADVVALDISTEAVRQVREFPRYDGEGTMIPLVGDAEYLPLADASVDTVLGKAIVHHLDLDRFGAEVARVLRPGGRFVFWEPLGTNPVINLFRRFTPQIRVPTEHPFTPAHLRQFGRCFDEFHCEYHLCTSLMTIPLFWWGLRQTPTWLLRRLDGLDLRWGRLFEPIRRLAWVVAIYGGRSSGSLAPAPGSAGAELSAGARC